MEELDLKELFNLFWHKKVQIILIVLTIIVVIWTVININTIFNKKVVISILFL